MSQHSEALMAAQRLVVSTAIYHRPIEYTDFSSTATVFQISSTSFVNAWQPQTQAVVQPNIPAFATGFAIGVVMMLYILFFHRIAKP